MDKAGWCLFIVALVLLMIILAIKTFGVIIGKYVSILFVLVGLAAILSIFKEDNL